MRLGDASSVESGRAVGMLRARETCEDDALPGSFADPQHHAPLRVTEALQTCIVRLLRAKIEIPKSARHKSIPATFASSSNDDAVPFSRLPMHFYVELFSTGSLCCSIGTWTLQMPYPRLIHASKMLARIVSLVLLLPNNMRVFNSSRLSPRR